MAAGDRREEIADHRTEYELAEREISRASAVLDRLETRADRAGRGVDDPDSVSAVTAFDRYLRGTDEPGVAGDRGWAEADVDRPSALSYLTENLLDGESALGGSHSPSTPDSESLATDIEEYVGGATDAGPIVDDVEALVETGDAPVLASLVALFERIVDAARAYRDRELRSLNGAGVDPGGTASRQTSPGGEGANAPGVAGALGEFFEEVSDELSVLDDEPIALLPVRLETRFVGPNGAGDGEATADQPDDTADEGGTADQPGNSVDGGDFNRTEPGQQELRIRVYPDQVHVDSHEPELTADEERWGRTFWAQLWFACHPSTTAEGEPTVDYDEGKLPDDLRGVVAPLAENPIDRYSTDDADRHAEIKERAWGQLVERFGTERAAWLVHALAPEGGTAMLVGWADGTAPWNDRSEPPALSLPDLDARPGSWSRQPRARLLPDRWLAVGRYRPADRADADPTEVRITGPPIQQPLPMGPNPERLPGEDDPEERPGHAPEGMEWMVDWPAARDVGMGLTVTADDLDGADPHSVVFEELLVVGVKATMDREESTDALRGLLGSHHYTDGLELMRRGTPTNNHDVNAGYRANPRPEETVGVECGPARTRFGDFSDGDLLSRALGIADPGRDHVFAHVDGAGARSQAAARHMNSVLWPGTIGYSLRNVLVDNQLADEESLWNDQGSMPSDPLSALGDRLKSLDAWRRHFVRYVRAGGPFPPIRIGRQPYGILPAERLRSGDDGDGTGVVRLPDSAQVDTGGGVSTVEGEVDIGGETGVGQPGEGVDVSGDAPATVPDDELTGEDVTGASTPDDSVVGEDATGGGMTGGDETAQLSEDVVTMDAEQPGTVDAAGYSAAMPETAAQTDADVYGSSFDPVTPPADESGETASKFPDGGVAATHLRQRPFRVDEGLPGELRTWLDRFTDAWNASVDNVDTVDDEDAGPELVERILGREANADDFVREKLAPVEVVPDYSVGGQYGMTPEEYRNQLRTMLRENEMDALDPRLAHLFPMDEVAGTHYPLWGARPIASVASDRAPHYLSYLHRKDPDFLRDMGIPTPLDKLNVNRESMKTQMGYGDGIDDLTEDQLAVDMLLREPDWDENAINSIIINSAGKDGLDIGNQGWDTPHARKMSNLLDTDGDSLQHTLFKQLTRFSTLRAYLSARTRLGVKWDETELLEELRKRFSASEEGTGPIPERPSHDSGTETAWDALEKSPSRYPDHDSFGELLHDTCRPGADEPAVDPRLREMLGSLAALESQSASDLRRLLTETMDLASHRLDAWWTSLATRRLYEHRETQEVDLYDGAEFEYVGDHFERGEGTQTPEPPSGGDQSGVVGDQSAGMDVADDAALAGSNEPVLRGRTEFGAMENAQSMATVTGTDDDAGETASPGEPATYVGAYAFVRNLHSDDLDDQVAGTDSATGGENAEYIHGPSPDHARTAAILRSGRKNHADDPELRELLDVDLTPGRIRAGKWVLRGVRQGQALGTLLGYRFERRLRERTKAYNDANDDTINLVKYKFSLREAYPAIEGQLDHEQDAGDDPDADGGDAPRIGTESAKSDVLDGYRLLTDWQDQETASFLAGIEYEDRGSTTADLDESGSLTDLGSALAGDERGEFVDLLEELEAIVDAVTDLLLSESVHQLGKGNFERAGGTIDDLIKGKPVAEPEVAETPREDVGVTHRLGVVFGDPDAATTPGPWNHRSDVIDPEGLPTVNASSGLAGHSVDADIHLQPRTDGEPNLDAWLGELLPHPSRVTCGATLRWTAERDVAVGSIELPTAPGRVAATDLEFAPDLVVLAVPHAVGRDGTEGAAGTHGWTHAIALRRPDGEVQQVSTSVGVDPTGSDGSGIVDDGGVTVQYHDAEGQHGEIAGEVQFADDGFTLACSTVDLPDGATEGAEVTYRAYALGNAATAEVGTFETAPGGGSQSVDLGIDADHAVLVGNTVATGTGTARTTDDGIGLSHGVATKAGGGIDQHALGSSLDPASGDAVGGVHAGEALHLPFAGGGTVAGTTAASVDGLGGSIDLTYGSTYAGGAGDASRAVAYLAIGMAERVDPPAVGVLDASRSEGGEMAVTTGFEPGAIEIIAAPEVATTGSDGSVPVAGFAHGAAVGPGRQFAATHAIRSAASGVGAPVVGAGETIQGHAVAIPDLADDGTVGGHDQVRVGSRSADGFTLSVSSVVDGDQVLCYRAWPAEPGEVVHSVEDTVSLDELELAPLDAVSLSQTNQQAGASQLEQRMHYRLLRDPPESEPAVPDEAVVELHFAEAGSGAPSDSVPVGAFLETVRELEQLVSDGRPLDAGDLGHPGEVEGPGYDGAAGDLAGRADDAQDRLAAAGELVENRVELLDIPEDAPEDATRITEDVQDLREAITAFDREVPIDAIAAVADRVAAALSEDQDALIDELDVIAEHLPAGPIEHDLGGGEIGVLPRPVQQLSFDTAAEDADVTLEVVSTSPVEWFERSRELTTDEYGNVETTVDFQGITPGASFAVFVRRGRTVLDARHGRVLPPEDGPTVGSAPAQWLRVVTDLDPGTSVTVTVTADGVATPLAEETSETDGQGYANVTVDTSGLDPWTCFDVTVEAPGGETVVDRSGYVEGTPAAEVADTEVLGPLLWLSNRTDGVDPYGDEGGAAALHTAVTETVDWSAVRTECELMVELHEATGGGPDATPAAEDIESVAALLETAGTDLESWDPAEGAVAALDLTALDAAVVAVGRSISGLVVDELFDVTGRPDRAGGLTFWENRVATTDERTLTRFDAFRSDPRGIVTEDRPELPVAPSLNAALGELASAAFPRGVEDARRLLDYLEVFLEVLPRLALDAAIRGELADPAGFTRHLHALVYHPEHAPAGGDRATFLADLRRCCRTDVLDGALYTSGYGDTIATAATTFEAVIASAGVDPPFYHEPSLGGGSGDNDGPGGGDGPGGDGPGELSDIRGPQLGPDALNDLDPDADSLTQVDGPGATPEGSPLTDFRWLLEVFRLAVVPEYLGSLDSGALPPEETDSAAAYAADVTARATTLRDTIDVQLDHVHAGRAAGAVDVSFRRGVLETLRRGMLRLSYFGIYGSTPQSPRGGTVEDLETLLGQARGVLETVRDRHRRAAALAPTGGVDPGVDDQRQRLHALFGDDFTVLPPFRPANGGELTATFGRSDELQGGDPLAAETWLQRIARVRDRPAVFRRSLTYAETLSGRRHRDLQVGQLPHRGGELWVGLENEEPEPGRTSVVAQFGAGFDGRFDAGPIAGLFVGEHVENVPTDTETTGVALNYDDPDVTAPQSVLIAMPPENGGWSREALEDVVADTYTLMQLRMVDLQDLTDFGSLLPMLTVPANTAADPDTPSMDVDLIGKYDWLAPDPSNVENFWGDEQ